jgi:hypothetical protein
VNYNDLRHECIPPTRIERLREWLALHRQWIMIVWAMLWYLMGMITGNLIWLMWLSSIR